MAPEVVLVIIGAIFALLGVGLLLLPDVARRLELQGGLHSPEAWYLTKEQREAVIAHSRQGRPRTYTFLPILWLALGIIFMVAGGVVWLI
jgi:hypothetical protein